MTKRFGIIESQILRRCKITNLTGATAMDDSIPTATDTATPVLDADNLIKVFTQFLSFDVADGAASAETIIAYWSQVKAYLNWCQTNSVDPAAASRERLK
jgi:hypothetical protein